MKILKPGKVEQRKFTCPKCGCEFVATVGDTEWWGDQVLYCPTCGTEFPWENGEPYEEPVEDAKECIYGVLLTAKPNATTEELADYLIANGVTFREE